MSSYTDNMYKYTPLQILQKIGLTTTQAQLYLACLEHGGLSVSKLYRITNIPRSTLYDQLNKLERLWYLTTQKNKGTQRWHAIAIQELAAHLEDKAQLREKTKNSYYKISQAFNNLSTNQMIYPSFVCILEENDICICTNKYKKQKT